MKNRILKSLLLVMGVMASSMLFGQAGNTGVTLDVEVVPKCEDDGATQTNFFSVYVFRVGDDAPQLFGHFEADGTDYTISDPGDVQVGFCSAAGGEFSIDTTYDYEMVPKCDTVNNESYYTLVLNKTVNADGSTVVQNIGDYDTDGDPYSPGASIAGYCQIVNVDTLYDYELVPKCDTDNDVGYFTLILKKTVSSTGAVLVSKIDDYDGEGSPYSPGASVVGYCHLSASRVERNVSRTESTTSGSVTVSNNTLVDCVIENVGFATGTITPNGEPASDLLPGERYYCHAVWDPTNNIWQICPDISWDATGTEFHIVIRTVPE